MLSVFYYPGWPTTVDGRPLVLSVSTVDLLALTYQKVPGSDNRVSSILITDRQYGCTAGYRCSILGASSFSSHPYDSKIRLQGGRSLIRMDLSELREIVARRHPWEIARFYFFSRLIHREGLYLKPVKALDIGSGDGWLAENLLPRLSTGSAITCWDSAYSERQLRDYNAASLAIHHVVQRPDGRFDLIFMLDVIEHVEHDQEFLTNVVEHSLVSGGTVIVSGPAWRILYGPHDIQLRHYRRYDPNDAIRLLEKSGLIVTSYGGLFSSLLLPRIAQLAAIRCRLAGGMSPTAGDWQGGSFTSSLLELVLKLDVNITFLGLAAGIRLPGLSWWAVCRKP